jgi:hypothetical protein
MVTEFGDELIMLGYEINLKYNVPGGSAICMSKYESNFINDISN